MLLWRHLPVIETVRNEKRGALSKIERAGVVRCRTVKGILRPVGFMEFHGSNFGSSLWKELCLFQQQPFELSNPFILKKRCHERNPNTPIFQKTPSARRQF